MLLYLRSIAVRSRPSTAAIRAFRENRKVMENSDALIELTTVDIVELSELYSTKQDVAPHIYSYLQNTLEWREKEGAQELIQVFVPKNCDWQETGTFVSVGHFPWKMIVLFTLEESGDQLHTALSKTHRFDYHNHVYLFYALHEKHVPFVDSAMAKRGLKKISEDKTDLWRLNQEEAILLIPSVPSEYQVAPLQPDDSTVVNDVWPHKSTDSEIYVRTLIEQNGGWGIHYKEDNELVAWILRSQLGQLALLQVSELHQRKGLAQAVIALLSKDIAEAGFPVLATILQTNVASQSLFTKSGFKKQFMCTFNVYK